jgi:hypothetical protein
MLEGWPTPRLSPKSTLWIHEGQERHDTGTLHGVGEVALLLGGETSEAAGKDLAALGDEFLEQINILVINWITGLDRGKTLLEEGAGHGIGETEEEGKMLCPAGRLKDCPNGKMLGWRSAPGSWLGRDLGRIPARR